MERKLALITGGTSGIGLGVAKALGAKYDLALSYAGNHEKAEMAKKELSGMYPEARIQVFSGAVLSYESAKDLVDRVKGHFSAAPSVLVNSAGRIKDGMFLGSNFADHEELVKEHLVVTMALSHLLLKDMYKNSFGRIINLSSISARYAKRGQANYAAAKAGIEGFTRTLALEVAHRGITINAVAPGLIETPMTRDILEKIKEVKGGLKAKIPAGVAGTPEDIGNLVRFLCEEGGYITGQVITIDGGRSLGDVSS